MSKVITVLPHALENIEKYIELFLDFYVTLYSDSGLWNEEFIIDDYRKKANTLHENILDYIESRVSKDPLPYELLSDWTRKSILTVEQRRLEIIYEESEWERIIYEIRIERR